MTYPKRYDGGEYPVALRKAPRILQAPCGLLAIPPYGLIVGWASDRVVCPRYLTLMGVSPACQSLEVSA